nr:enolase-phosphatase E1-like [Procambarus clarkii]
MKRSQKSLASIVKDVETIMVDIEGTTTSISFVKEVLFPYVRREITTHLRDTWDTHHTRHDVAALKQQVREDVSAGVEGVEPLPSEDDHHALVSALAACVLAMMDADRKVAALKTLQGHMWHRAYHTGAITAHVYEDVVGALQEWKESGKRLVVYSSGSVQAQKLLFTHSCHGDLLHFFSEHFDTTVGAKVEVESYRRILQHLDCSPEKVLFITDLAKGEPRVPPVLVLESPVWLGGGGGGHGQPVFVL